jgi:L-asparaginase
MASCNHVYIITTGGTIDKDYPRLTSGYAFEFGEESAASRILKMHPNLGHLTFEVTSVCKKDSLEINDDDRRVLVSRILRVINERKMVLGDIMRQNTRIVVTHGTDTMIDTAKFVKRELERAECDTLPISIAFTGATKPERFVDSDAAFNLGGAVSATSQCTNGISVVICMHGNIIEVEKCTRLENGIFCQTE